MRLNPLHVSLATAFLFPALGGIQHAFALTWPPKSAQADRAASRSVARKRFANWATVWRRAYTPEEAAVRLVTDPHAPSMFRAVGTPSNMEAFAKAFGCRSGDLMVREGNGRIVIW